MELKGIKICYDATTAGAYLDALRVQHLRYSGGNVTIVNDYWDYTDVDTKGCSLHYFTTPAAMAGNDQVVVSAWLNFTDTNATLFIGGVTFYLDPSDTVLAVP
jgi:hypothetical protein